MSEASSRLTLVGITKAALGLSGSQLFVEQIDLNKELKKTSVNDTNEFANSSLGKFLTGSSGGLLVPNGADGKPSLTTSYAFTRDAYTYYLEFEPVVLGEAASFANNVKTLLIQDAGKTDPENFADGSVYDLVGDVKFLEGKPTLVVKHIVRTGGGSISFSSTSS